MKAISTIALVSLLAALPCFALEEKLTSADGTTSIMAEITRVTQTHAYIIHKGKAMKVEFGKFSDETQAFLKEWKEMHVSYNFRFQKNRLLDLIQRVDYLFKGIQDG